MGKDPSNDSAQWFHTTQWSMVLAIHGKEEEAGQALEQLCLDYWSPVYAFLRRSGQRPDQAEDLAQAFFCDMLTRKALEWAHPDRGRFRCFILTCLKNFLADQHDKATSLKRGGHQPLLSLDVQEAEHLYATDNVQEASPDQVYDRRWALTLMNQALKQLEREYQTTNRETVFLALSPYLFHPQESLTFKELASNMGVPEATLRSWIFRMRRRYGEIIRQRIACTVSEQAEIEEEIRYLISVVSALT